MIRLGPFSLEYQSGKPYLVNGYQLEPMAWVLKASRAGVEVPSQGPVAGGLWAWTHVRPVAVKVTDSLGRRYTLPLAKRRLGLRLIGVAALALLVVAFLRCRRKQEV